MRNCSKEGRDLKVELQMRYLVLKEQQSLRPL